MPETSPTLEPTNDSRRSEIEIPLRLSGRAFSSTSLTQLPVSVPLPQGAVHAADWLVRTSDDAELIACSSVVLARWSDQSIRWLQVVLPVQALRESRDELTLICQSPKSRTMPSSVAIDKPTSDRLIISTGAAQFSMSLHSAEFLRFFPTANASAAAEHVCRLHLTDAQDRIHSALIESWELLETSTSIATVHVRGTLGKRTGLRWAGKLSFFADSAQVRLEITAQNPRRAKHPDGYWDLGDPASILLRDLSLEVTAEIVGSRQIEWQTELNEPVHQTKSEHWEIYQESSGGEHWNSVNHVNRHSKVPLSFRGFRVRYANEEARGERASPIVAIISQTGHIACAVEAFWQKFPTAIEVEKNRLHVRLWPKQCDDLHELQAGEHNTRVIWFACGSENNHACQSLASVYDPPRVAVDTAWLAASGCVSNLPLPDFADRAELQSLLQQALNGPRSFFAKREVIDEYGWRNYGDMWADHEEAYSEDPRPVISHYNNQYDLLHGLLIQYLRSHDSRWWELAEPLARHVMDIDIYHTQRDKSSYNGGLFWHTAHYHAVGQCTHRCMSPSMRGKKNPAPGAGPCNEHNYSSGLLLYYYLTGSSEARNTVIGLAEWVIAMDDGTRHILGLASDLPTGAASSTADPHYHGPGRGCGNSIVSLLNGWLVAEDERFLEKASELIRRCIHPHDDLAARQLGNAEMRWSYTVFLQALMRFLEVTKHRTDLAELRAYTKAALLHYVRWMAEQETCYLDEPEKLEFPTETWAAQELRKGTVMLMAAHHATTAEATWFQQRGGEMLDRAWQKLISFESRVCTRPLALVLQQGYLETSLRNQPLCSDQAETVHIETYDFGVPSEFVSQRQTVKSSLKSLHGWFKLASCATRPTRWLNALRQTWLAERMRQMFE